MTAQPEALRLADLLESCCLTIGDAQQAVAAAELRRLHTQRDALLEALQDLYDEQEGPPLVRRKTQWQAAMEKAIAAINKVNGTK